MSKRSLIAYILCGALLLGICSGIGFTAKAVIDDMVETAAYEIMALETGKSDGRQDDVPIEPTTDATISTEDATTESDSTEPSVDGTAPVESEPDESVPDESVPVATEPDETKPVETGPAETVPGETEPISDDTGDGKPSGDGDIEGNGPGNDGDKESPSDTETDSSKEDMDEEDPDSGQPVTILIAYKVQRGDTLNEIAAAHGVDPAIIADLNDIENINLIYVGEVFLIPVESICCTCCTQVS